MEDKILKEAWAMLDAVVKELGEDLPTEPEEEDKTEAEDQNVKKKRKIEEIESPKKIRKEERKKFKFKPVGNSKLEPNWKL